MLKNLTEMARRRTQLLVATALLAVVACGIGWYAYREYHRIQFLRGLRLVGFSTSMIGSPSAEQERASQQHVKELDIDLFDAYTDNLEDEIRFSLAWLLITSESAEYCEFAQTNLASVPWPEVRIWAVRRDEDSLSSDYRARLLGLLLASPTSEAKLVVARGYRTQGKITQSEDAYYAAMINGQFWDTLDAADRLVESERYREAAVRHLLSVVRDSEHFTRRAAISLLSLYGVRAELEPLVESCSKEPKDGPKRTMLVDKLTQLVEKDTDSSNPSVNASEAP